ncbi:MAG TPA: hypothetical protein VGX48_11620 [Pyrinomonadaceae bacterium]|jgi:hypothetical protein|nr:hypothetical protein [Pyrinomonadaceae bacterium]
MSAEQIPVEVFETRERAASPRGSWWLFSPRLDLCVFAGSAAVALLLLWVGVRAGVADGDSPDWTWVPAVLLVDVAHVWATGFRVYFDREELRRRPWLYGLAPAIALALGVALYSEGEALFWRSLAYLAVFHFVRQQYGWVALYRARLGERGRLGFWIDAGAVYMATLYPLAYWHANLPRNFWWFLAGDFAQAPLWVERAAWPLYCAALGAYAVRSGYAWLVRGEGNPGKDVVVMTTAVCWYAGIVAYNSDYAFTVTNVVIHGIPYMALVWWHARRRAPQAGRVFRAFVSRPVFFLAALWLLAYAEELLWDRGVWHERAWLFGASFDPGQLKVLLVPLLALPQATHYVLDGFIWRRRSNPGMVDNLRTHAD